MKSLILASLRNPIAVTVGVLALMVLGALAAVAIPVDILPVYNSPAVQTLVFYSGMPAANIEKAITARLERGVVQASGGRRLESRSIVGASIVRNYFQPGTDRNGAMIEVNSLAGLEYPTMPPGTLPPVVLPYDPTSTTPACLLALDSDSQDEAALYDIGRYEVRPQVMSQPGAIAPLVYGGRVRAIMLYLDRQRLQARGLSPVDVLNAVDNYNVFLPTGSAKLGPTDYAIDSNSTYDAVEEMGEIPLRTELGNAAYLRDVGTPRDASFIQTSIVRVNGKRQVYIPVFRQLGASTLKVVDNLRASLGAIKSRLTRPGVDLKVVMDQSVYVRKAIRGLIEEGLLGAVLCSLVILLFLGQWRMTAIAALTIPIAILSAVAGLYATGNTLNLMTLAGLALAIGPLVDSAIICLENIHRHLVLGASPDEAALRGASEVALPELVASLCTLLVLAPLALAPGLGEFLYRPMALAVTFAMVTAYLLSRTFVPSRAARWLAPRSAKNEDDHEDHSGIARRAFARWEAVIDRGIAAYIRVLDLALRSRLTVVLAAVVLLIGIGVLLGPRLRREFFPEVDSGAFEMYVRAPSGTRVEVTEERVVEVERMVHDRFGKDLGLIVSEIGVVADLSAAYTPNAGPMDAVVRVQLTDDRTASAQEHIRRLRTALLHDHRFTDLDFAFDAGGMIRSAMNEGKSAPISIRVIGNDLAKARRIAKRLRRATAPIKGVVDARIIQRLDYPEFIIDVDKVKAAELGLTQAEVMKNVVAALNSSIQFHKRNFWIDPVSHNQYFVGVQYAEEKIKSLRTILDVPITGPNQPRPVPLRNLAAIRPATVPSEVTHSNLQASVDLTMGVEGRDLGHVAGDVARAIDKLGRPSGHGMWVPYDPSAEPDARRELGGYSIELGGEYSRMLETFRTLGVGLVLATLLIYFLMAALFRSYLTPLIVLLAVPMGLIGVALMLFATGTAVNIQSLLGVVFMVGIVVSNTVLLVDFAQHLRAEEGWTPLEAIRAAASVRVRPVVMTALAALFALLPMALAMGRGSEANAPLGRAVIGGILAGLATTLIVVPCLYSLLLTNRATPPTSEGGPETA